KQYKMLRVIDTLYTSALACVKRGIPLSTIRKERVFDDVVKMKYDVPNDQVYLLDELEKKIIDTYRSLREKYE
ncbi:MAG: V-type ATP synthase subunit A, partial [Niameybacter sp.]